MTLIDCFNVMWFHMHCCLNWLLSGSSLKMVVGPSDCISLSGNVQLPRMEKHLMFWQLYICGLRCLFFWREETGFSCVYFLGVSLTKNASFYNYILVLCCLSIGSKNVKIAIL